MQKTCFITGATSGIGEACAKKLAENGCNLIICGRRIDRLESLKRLLESKFNSKIFILNFDITNSNEVFGKINNLPDEWKSIDILINNAGLALGLNSIIDGEIGDWSKMIDTNIKGLLYVTKSILPFMIAKGNGHIINIGSIAGKVTYQNGNVYCATKAAVDALSKAMSLELLKKNIKVTQILPGAVETEFSTVRFKGDSERAKKAYLGFKPLSAEDVADAIYYAVYVSDSVNIAEIFITPSVQSRMNTFNKKNI